MFMTPMTAACGEDKNRPVRIASPLRQSPVTGEEGLERETGVPKIGG
jgi:hypothetical protein